MGDVLWAPWRMEHIVADNRSGCLFCEKSRERCDADNYIVWRGEAAFIMLNRYPYAYAHLLVVPYAHVASLTELGTPQRAALLDSAAMCEAILQHVLHPDGLNLGMNLGVAAGASIADHLHLHIVPRWHGDINYMTVVGDIHVIPQHLEHTYHLLVPYFQAHNPVSSI